jgi:hypothetical protein
MELICEGDCNPRIERVDAAVTEYREHESSVGTVYPVPDDLVVRLRALQHTPHRASGHDLAVCEVCGTERRYGFETYFGRQPRRRAPSALSNQ